MFGWSGLTDNWNTFCLLWFAFTSLLNGDALIRLLTFFDNFFNSLLWWLVNGLDAISNFIFWLNVNDLSFISLWFQNSLGTFLSFSWLLNFNNSFNWFHFGFIFSGCWSAWVNLFDDFSLSLWLDLFNDLYFSTLRNFLNDISDFASSWKNIFTDLCGSTLRNFTYNILDLGSFWKKFFLDNLLDTFLDNMLYSASLWQYLLNDFFFFLSW